MDEEQEQNNETPEAATIEIKINDADEETKKLTLRDFLEFAYWNRLIIINEINEILIIIDNAGLCVKDPTKYLRDDLLDRNVLGSAGDGDIVNVRIDGEYDAE